MICEANILAAIGILVIERFACSKTLDKSKVAGRASRDNGAAGARSQNQLFDFVAIATDNVPTV